MQQNFQDINTKIEAAAYKAGRNANDVTLVAVIKKQPVDKIIDYCSYLQHQSRLPVIADNYVQDFNEKIDSIPKPFESHLIGRLQSNKVKSAVALFDLIESVDSLKLARLIDQQAQQLNKIQKIFLQINVSDDPLKAGFKVDQLSDSLLSEIAAFRHLKVEGLMTITQLYSDKQLVRADFRSLKQLASKTEQCFNLTKCCLSMGMSEDFEIAIEEGATHVRIGTALFGGRAV